MGMSQVLLLVVLVAICVCNIVFPRRMWGLFKAWRFQNPDVVEPSVLVLWWYRVSSSLFLILLVGGSVYVLMEQRRDDRCESVLAELRNLSATGGVPAVRQRADELDLDVEVPAQGRGAPRGKIVITEDGEPFATLWALTSEGHCDT